MACWRLIVSSRWILRIQSPRTKITPTIEKMVASGATSRLYSVSEARKGTYRVQFKCHNLSMRTNTKSSSVCQRTCRSYHSVHRTRSYNYAQGLSNAIIRTVCRAPKQAIDNSIAAAINSNTHASTLKAKRAKLCRRT